MDNITLNQWNLDLNATVEEYDIIADNSTCPATSGKKWRQVGNFLKLLFNYSLISRENVLVFSSRKQEL